MNRRNIVPIIIISVIVIVLAGVLVVRNLPQLTKQTNQEETSTTTEKEVFDSEFIEENDKGEKVFSRNFSDFNDLEPFDGKIADVNFEDNPQSQNVSSTVKEITQKGPTFASKYAVATYSCGDECQKSTIVDVTTGEIIADGLRSVYGVSYRVSSRLFIVNPSESIPEDKTQFKEGVSIDYYAVEDGKLMYLGKQDIDDNDEACAQVVITAENEATGEVVNFPTPCDVPEYGWIVQ